MQTLFVDKTLADIIIKMNPAVLIIDELHQCGYHYNFKLTGQKLTCLENQTRYRQISFHVDEIYRMNGGILQPNGYSIFALRHRSEPIKGIFIAI